MFDCIIIGGGPAGSTAAIYLKRAGKNVALIEKEMIGGNVSYTPQIENIPGFTSISGIDYATSLLDQLDTLNVNIIFDTVVAINKINDYYNITTLQESLQAKTVILATGTKHRLLGLQNEEEFIGKGISFCVTCDGPFYEGKDVAVIGGGNSAVTEALELSKICKDVYLLQNLPELTCEDTLKQQLAETQVKVITSCTINRLLIDNNKFKGLAITANDKEIALNPDGVFYAIGLVPNTDFISEEFKSRGYIKSDNCDVGDGLFAAGDCNNNYAKQITIACGEGTIAALKAKAYVESR